MIRLLLIFYLSSCVSCHAQEVFKLKAEQHCTDCLNNYQSGVADSDPFVARVEETSFVSGLSTNRILQAPTLRPMFPQLDKVENPWDFYAFRPAKDPTTLKRINVPRLLKMSCAEEARSLDIAANIEDSYWKEVASCYFKTRTPNQFTPAIGVGMVHVLTGENWTTVAKEQAWKLLNGMKPEPVSVLTSQGRFEVIPVAANVFRLYGRNGTVAYISPTEHGWVRRQ